MAEIGQCTFEEVADEDLVDAASTLPGGYSWGAITDAPGSGVDSNVYLAEMELKRARSANNQLDKNGHWLSAVMHSRRALGCLVDWYLASNNFNLCKPALSEGAKSELLVRRGVIDELSARVVKRVIDLRNDLEHRYQFPDPNRAEDAVELVRRLIHFITITADPSKGPWLFGTPLQGSSYLDETFTPHFNAWTEFCFVICGFFDRPWLGVIEPTGEKSANVRRCYFDNVRLEIFESILKTLEAKYRAPGSSMSAWACREQAIAAGLNG